MPSAACRSAALPPLPAERPCGLEFASGIPGSVGGGVMMNAGAYGGELKDAVESVVCYYLPEQRLYEVTAEKCQFGYRDSFFKKLPGNVIISAVFRLHEGDKDEIAAKMRELNERRRDKQPLDLPSAGSAFKRPEGHCAAALIDEAGLKGFSVGGAQVSEKARRIHRQHRQRHLRRHTRAYEAGAQAGVRQLKCAAGAGDNTPAAGLQAGGQRPQVPRNKFIGLEEMTGGPEGKRARRGINGRIWSF